MDARQQAQMITSAVNGLEKDGFALIDGLATAGAMSAVGTELAPHFDQTAVTPQSNFTKRVHSRALIEAPELQQRIIDPVVMGVMDRLLAPNCVKYQLSSVQGIEVYPGARDQSLHRDDDIFRLPHPHPVFEVNVMWAVTDFTAANGATRLIANSHNWPTNRVPQDEQPISAVMEKGSALLWLGSTWHGAGTNQSDQSRSGLYAGYSLGWLRQEETMYLALPPESVRPMPEPLQRLVGYELKGSSTLGWLDGRDPREVLDLHSPN